MLRLPTRLSFHLTISLVFALLVVMVSIAVVSFRYQEATLVKQVQAEVIERTENISFAIEQMLDTKERAILGLANSFGELTSTEQLKTQFEENVSTALHMSSFDSMWLFSKDGQLVSALYDEDAKAEASLVTDEQIEAAAETYFLPEAIASSSFWVSEPYVLARENGKVLTFAYPLFNDEEYLGSIAGNILVDENVLFQRLRNLDISESGHVALISSQLNIIFHPYFTDPSSNLTPQARLELTEKIGAENATSSVEPYSEQRWLQTYVRIPHYFWVVGIAVPLSEAHADIDSLQMVQLRAGIIATLCAILFISFIVRYRLRVFKRLTKQVEQVRQGKSIVLGKTGLDEIDLLVNRFNELLHENESSRQEAKQRQTYLDLILSTSSIGHFMANSKGRFEYVNDSMIDITGFEREELLSGAFESGVHESGQEKVRERWREGIEQQRDYEMEFKFDHKDQHVIWLHIKSKPVFDHGICLGHVGTVSDVTEHHSKIEDLQSKAYQDELTGLLNRRGIEQVMYNAWHDAQLFNKPLVFLALDLDNFKQVNDTFGHEEGDWILEQVAETLNHAVRDTDWVGRLGGDEFVIVLPGCPQDRAITISEHIVTAISTIAQSKNLSEVTVSIGIAEYKDSDQSELDMLRRADKAAYQAKNSGKNQWYLSSD